MNEKTIRPTVEALDELVSPASVWLGVGGMLNIQGGNYRDVVSVRGGAGGRYVIDDGFNLWTCNQRVNGIRFWGFGGNDWFCNYTSLNCWAWGGLGNDCIYGGWGNDYCWGQGGNDWLFGQGGNDWCYGGVGNNYLYGGWGNNSLYGNSWDSWSGGIWFDWSFNW
jgi:Ca2+-binding RTX toxin-like protein